VVNAHRRTLQDDILSFRPKWRNLLPFNSLFLGDELVRDGSTSLDMTKTICGTKVTPLETIVAR
jgi:hypothetical protein